MAKFAFDGKKDMIDTASLPWDDTDGTTMARTSADPMARASCLANAAMNTVSIDNSNGKSDYARTQAEYQVRLAAIRNENAQRHVAANNARAAAAASVRAERLSAHLARNA